MKNIKKAIFIAFILSSYISFEGKCVNFKFKSGKDWIESTDFRRSLAHFQGTGTIYNIQNHGKFYVESVSVKLEQKQSRFNCFPKKLTPEQMFAQSIKLLKESTDNDQRVVSFNEIDQIAFSLQNRKNWVILSLHLKKK